MEHADSEQAANVVTHTADQNDVGGDEQATQPPDSLLDEFWSVAKSYSSNKNRSDTSMREAVAATAAKLAGLSNAGALYVAKVTAKGYGNQVWQGKALSQSNEVMFLVDKTDNEELIANAARSRLSPLTESGFGAVVICESASDGHRIVGVVEYEHVEVAETLAKTVHDLVVHRVPDPASAAALPLEAATELGTSGAIHDILVHLNESKNVILAGPPGTGKTHAALETVIKLAGSEVEQFRLEGVLQGREWHEVPLAELHAPPLIWDLIQLHPSYAYEDFVRGLRTDPTVEGFSLIPVDGILPIISHVASARKGKPTLLIIDELNRCNLPAVFGETIFAVDPAQRGRPIRLQYDGIGILEDVLRIPPNLFIIGTMNTADQSISAIDFAIRRRFRFLHFGPSEEQLANYYGKGSVRARITVALCRSINAIVPDREIHIGHSYLMTKRDADAATWRQSLIEKLVYEVMPLLREYAEEGRIPDSGTISLAGFELDIINASSLSLFNDFDSAITRLVTNDEG